LLGAVKVKVTVTVTDSLPLAIPWLNDYMSKIIILQGVGGET
jgi:hypothetical protein